MLAASAFAADPPVFLPVITVATAAIVYLSRRIPRFLRVLGGMLVAARILLLAILLAAASGLMPEALAGYVPPASTSVGASAFAALIYGLSSSPWTPCNRRFGRGTVVPAAAHVERRRSWSTKFQMRRPRYTTRLDQLPLEQG